MDDIWTVAADAMFNDTITQNDVGVGPPTAGYSIFTARQPSFTTPGSNTSTGTSVYFTQAGNAQFSPSSAGPSGGLPPGTVVSWLYQIVTPSYARSNNATVRITVTPGGWPLMIQH